jgi:aryl-alcohol dehydrogenase-like predicted oxidoreductase
MSSAPQDETGAIPPRGPRTIDDTGVVVNPIALDGEVFGWAAGVDDTALVLDRFHEAGGNLVCTADHYAGGRSEIMIGGWLRRLDDRSSVILSTTVGRHPDASGLTQRSILRAVESSLERLETDYIDFLSIDGDRPGIPIDDALEAVDRLIREGKVRYLSATGFSAARIAEVARFADESRYPRFRAIFVDYNLMERQRYETELQPSAVRLGRGALARLPLASGYLSGGYRTREEVPHSVMFEASVRHIGRRGSRVLDALEAVARELESTPTRVALAWVLVKPGIAAVVLGAKDADQLDHALGAAELRLTRHHVALLDRASAS